MKITADATKRETYVVHEIVDAPLNIRYAKLDENHVLMVTVQSKEITLTPDAVYMLTLHLDPAEIDALHRASLTLPVPQQDARITRRL